MSNTISILGEEIETQINSLNCMGSQTLKWQGRHLGLALRSLGWEPTRAILTPHEDLTLKDWYKTLADAQHIVVAQ